MQSPTPAMESPRIVRPGDFEVAVLLHLLSTASFWGGVHCNPRRLRVIQGDSTELDRKSRALLDQLFFGVYPSYALQQWMMVQFQPFLMK